MVASADARMRTFRDLCVREMGQLCDSIDFDGALTKDQGRTTNDERWSLVIRPWSSVIKRCGRFEHVLYFIFVYGLFFAEYTS